MWREVLAATLIVLAVVALAAAQGTTGDWPKFRGDLQNTGYGPGRISDELELRWKKRLPRARAYWSSPCIVGGKLFVGNNDGCVYCLDAATGKLIWEHDTETRQAVYSSPTVAYGLVFCACYRRIFALPVKDPNGDGVISKQEMAWSYEVGPSTGGVNDVVCGSPAVKDGKLFLGAVDQYFYCFDARLGGRPLWKIYTEYRGQHAFSSSPAISKGKVLAATGNQSGSGRLYCFDEECGCILWDFDIRDITYSSPAIDGDRVYIANSGDWIQGNRIFRLFCLDIDGYLDEVDDGVQDDNRGGADLLWSHESTDYVFSSPACHDGRVFYGCADGSLTCLDASSGKLEWRLKTPQGRSSDRQPRGISGSPAIAGRRVIIGTYDGRLLAVPVKDPNGDKVISEDEIVWSHRIGRQVVASPAVANGAVYIGNYRGTLYCFGPSGKAK